MMELSQVKEVFNEKVKNLQSLIVEKMKKIDTKINVKTDPWERLDFNGHPGGGGTSMALTGEIFEKAGVNVSQIYGDIDPTFAKSLKSNSTELYANGISLIIHPISPRVPTVHANFRFIHTGEKFWFGGGADLTPYYPYTEDFQYFHDYWKENSPNDELYQTFKENCDDYFTNHHRNGEMRGVGGIFYDHFNSGNIESDLNMSLNYADAFIGSYFPIVEKRKDEAYTDEDVDFQAHRRGRYVEFNLIHDRGTLFGLKTNGRTESILTSLPPRCKFTYNYSPKPGSVYHKMWEHYYKKK